MVFRLAVVVLSLAYLGQPVALGQSAGYEGQRLPTEQGIRPDSPTARPPSETLESFDLEKAELRWGQGGWQLWAGSVFLKDFGKKEQDARTVLHLIRELHLDTRGRLGAPQAVAEYWLSAGKPPSAAPDGARTLAFDPSRLSVVQVDNQWMLRDRRRTLLGFGTNEAEARRALGVFDHYHFDRVAFVGEPTPSFMYFLSSSDEMQEKRSVPAELQESLKDAAKPIHVVKAGSKQADPKQSGIDPRAGSQLLPPGRQLIQVNNLPGQTIVPGQVPFNWQRARLQQIGDSWELAAQDVTIARLGPDESTAREALTLLQHYHFTELCLIGGDDPSFSYLLANGRMPRELRFGVSSIAFHAERVRVRQVGSEFMLEEEGTCIYNFGPREDDARCLCEFIRQNNPDHLCWVGPDLRHALVFFVRSSLAPFNSRNDAARKP